MKQKQKQELTRSVSAPRDWARTASSERVVVLAASAGGLQALASVLAGLPSDFPAAIVVVQHRAEHEMDLLPELLGRQTALTVRAAQTGDVLRPGTVYVCPPGSHVVAEHSLRLLEGSRLDHVRPSANVLLSSVASTYGSRSIGVVLSGNGSDGASGALTVARAGGIVIAQDPATATHPAMPTATVERGDPEYVVPLEDLSALLLDLVRGPPPATPERIAQTTAIRVVVADDHRIILDGLRTLLASEEGIDVVGEAEDGATAVALARDLAPDVVVLDVGMPSLDGIEATRRIKAERGGTKVVVLTAFVDDKRAARILDAGATACLSKDAAFAELATAIREAAAGHPYFSARVASVFARQQHVPRAAAKA